MLSSSLAPLAQAVERSLLVAAPRLLTDALMTRWKHSKPSASTVRESEFAVDMALLLVLHQKHRHTQHFRFGLCDASPIAGFDWLWSQRVQIRCGGESCSCTLCAGPSVSLTVCSVSVTVWLLLQCMLWHHSEVFHNYIALLSVSASVNHGTPSISSAECTVLEQTICPFHV